MMNRDNFSTKRKRRQMPRTWGGRYYRHADIFRMYQFRVPNLIKRIIDFNYINSTGSRSTPRRDVPVSHEVDHQVNYNRGACSGWISTPGV